MTRTPKLGDTVVVSPMLLLDDRYRCEGKVVAVADDGWITVEIPQPGGSPMRVTSLPEHFTVVHSFDLPDATAAELARVKAELRELGERLVATGGERDRATERARVAEYALAAARQELAVWRSHGTGGLTPEVVVTRYEGMGGIPAVQEGGGAP